jgi:hypothetical protein
MSYTKALYQSRCTECANTKIGACKRHFFMFCADSKSEELYGVNKMSIKKNNNFNYPSPKSVTSLKSLEPKYSIITEITITEPDNEMVSPNMLTVFKY